MGRTEKDLVELHVRHLKTNRLLNDENELLKAKFKAASRALKSVQALLIMIKNRKNLDDIRYLADEALEIIANRKLD